MSPAVSARVISDREFVLEHRFRAAPARVFAAYTDPKLIAQWWAPPGGTIEVEEMEVRPGGRWRFRQHLPNRPGLVFSGEYLEVRPVTRLVYTFQVEGQPGSELTATVELTEEHGETRLTLTNRCGSREVRDAMLSYGAAAGANAAWTALDRVLSSETP